MENHLVDVLAVERGLVERLSFGPLEEVGGVVAIEGDVRLHAARQDPHVRAVSGILEGALAAAVEEIPSPVALLDAGPVLDLGAHDVARGAEREFGAMACIPHVVVLLAQEVGLDGLIVQRLEDCVPGGCTHPPRSVGVSFLSSLRP